jgi:hypothetical protein
VNDSIFNILVWSFVLSQFELLESDGYSHSRMVFRSQKVSRGLNSDWLGVETKSIFVDQALNRRRSGMRQSIQRHMQYIARTIASCRGNQPSAERDFKARSLEDNNSSSIGAFSR